MPSLKRWLAAADQMLSELLERLANRRLVPAPAPKRTAARRSSKGKSSSSARLLLFALGSLAATSLATAAEPPAAEPTAEDIEFFENKIRPVLVKHCYECHSADAAAKGDLESGLLLDTREGIRKGGDTGPGVAPGDLEASLVLAALKYDELQMPPDGKLSEAIIGDFTRWIQRGAPDPRDGNAAIGPRREKFRLTDEDRSFWAFQPIVAEPSPKVEQTAWPQSPLDHFVLARLEKRGLAPAAPAEKHALLRRVTFDLTGLPPAPAEVEQFMADDSPAAYEQAVNRLLDSPEFGVRWARHWLDGVRYASDYDKEGRYRDWVVRSFNNDLPYDQFIKMQIAGDLLPAATDDPGQLHPSGASLDGITATGMLALAVWEQVAVDLAVAEIADSQIDVVGRQVLGLTLACARCHDHKFDPISNEDYYALAGIFLSSNVAEGKVINDARLSAAANLVPLLSQADVAHNRPLEEKAQQLKDQINAIKKAAGPAYELWTVRNELAELAEQIKSAKDADRKKLQEQQDKLQGEEKKLLADSKQQGWSPDRADLQQIPPLRAEVIETEAKLITPPTVMAAEEGGVPTGNRRGIHDAPIYIRGDHRRLGPVVPRRFPLILAGEAQTPLGEQTKQSGRLELAHWIADRDNPLTPRVAVNRLWQHLFGMGLVRTPDNFGRLGELPTHPKLLDHLASRLVESGWSMKTLIREIVLSSTYRQGSFPTAEALAADPENRLWGRTLHRRLEYEAIRDNLLAVSGRLALIGEQPAKGDQRRTLYETVTRKKTGGMMAMFDGADPLAIVPERAQTTTAPQALFMMNNPFVLDAASALAAQVERDASLKEPSDQVHYVFQRLFSRPPSEAELQIGQRFLAAGSLKRYCHVLFCTNEFVYLD